MGRKASLTPEQVSVIRSSKLTLKKLSEIHSVSLLTVWKAKNFKSPYQNEVLEGLDPSDASYAVLDT